MNHDQLRAAALGRELLEIRWQGGRFAILPLWDDPDTGAPTLLVWTAARKPWLSNATWFQGAEVLPGDRLELAAVEVGRNAVNAVTRAELLAVAARFTLDVAFEYDGKARQARALRLHDSLFFAARLDLFNGASTPRNAPVPKIALRSYRLERFAWAVLLKPSPLRWKNGSGYTVEVP